MPDQQPVRHHARLLLGAVPFACTWTNDDLDAPWVHVTGRLDAETTPQLQRTLREAQLHVSVVVLDLRWLSFLDGFAVRAIVGACARSHARGASLLLVPGANRERFLALAGGGADVEHVELAEIQPRVRTLLGRA